MILQALVKRYEDTKTVPLGWKKRAVSYALDISEDGKLLGVLPLEEEVERQIGGKLKKIMQKREFILPEPPVRSSGIKEAFLCDDASYLFGMDEKRGKEKFEANKKLHHHALENFNCPVSNAIKAWFSAGITGEFEQYIGKIIPEKEISKASFVFQINGEFADYKNINMRNAWNAHSSVAEENQNERIRCLVTNKLDTPERIHGKIKLRGGQSAGSNLISINAESFASYGKTASDRAADIGKYAAFAHVTALNDLLNDEKQRKFIGGDTLVYWTEENSRVEIETFNNYWDIQPTENDSEKLTTIIEKIANIRHFDIEGCKMERPFYLLCLSPNAARISVRFFYTATFGEIINNLMNHYRNMDIVGDNIRKFTHLPHWIILNETTSVPKESKKVTPLLGGQFVKSILSGTPYPQTLYNAILVRIRSGEEINKTKAAVIKAVLIKNYNEVEVTKVSLNKQTSNKPYVLGRLFAVLEQLQYKAAGGGLNATIRDKYFASACANPSSVFPTLLKLSMHHAAKLDNSVFFEKLKGELLAKLDAESPFPVTLGLDDQGKFILGYYHQKQDFFTKKENKTEDESQ